MLVKYSHIVTFIDTKHTYIIKNNTKPQLKIVAKHLKLLYHFEQ